MRGAVLIALLPACTILNPLDPALLDRDGGCVGCVEGDQASCTNGQDDDLDGRIDCADPDCTHLFECFDALTFARAERCPRARPALLLADEFDDFLAGSWIVFGAVDAPRIGAVPGGTGLMLDENSGIASQTKFGVGAQQSFDLSLVLALDGQCENGEADSRCVFALDVHTRDDWVSGASGGESIFGLVLTATKDRGGFDLSCTYHERQLGGAIHHTIQADLLARIVISVESTLSGTIVLRYGGEEVCTTPAIQPLEPLARLVMRRSGHSPGSLLIDSVHVNVREEHVTPECEGRTVGRGVIADSYCRRDFEFQKGMSGPTVARSPSGYELLFTGVSSADSAVWGALSSDGRHDFVLRREIDARAFESSIEAGAMYYDADADRLVGYGAFDSVPYRYVAMKEPPNGVGAPYSEWWEDQPVMLSLPADLGPLNELPIVETLVRDAGDAKFRAWFAAPSMRAEGKRAIYSATSNDGVAFTSLDAPVLEAGAVGEWDLDGVYAPSVVWTGEYFLMAYSAKAFFGHEAIGLAASKDGTHWLKRTDNPIFTGADETFDDGGASEPSLLIEDGMLRIWYTATTFPTRRCPDPGQDTGVETRIGLVELMLGPASAE